MFRAIVTSLALVAIVSSSAQSAQLINIQGDVLVNKGDGYKPVIYNVVVSPGDRVLVVEGSVEIVYENGFIQTLGHGQVALVVANPAAPAVASQVALVVANPAAPAVANAPPSFSGKTLLIGGLIVSGIAGGAILFSNAGESSRPISP